MCKRLRVLLVVLLLCAFSTQPVSAECKYSCDVGYDWVQCWYWISGSLGNMANCSEVCDCIFSYCGCWCAGDQCYWT